MIDGLCYEIIVADDGSTNDNVLITNRRIAQLGNCRFIENGINVGRAAIRNRLVKEAQHEWVVFLDCEVKLSEKLIYNYSSCMSQADVVCGGVTIGGDCKQLSGNLRYLYEKSMEPSYTAEERNKHGYYSFRTTNNKMKRSVARVVLFNEENKTDGYEDVVFGKELKTNGFTIEHIDNPVGMYRYEANKRFVEKTEEALRTLRSFSEEIGDYSPIITFTKALRKFHLFDVTRFSFSLLNKKLRKNLCGDHPKSFIYKLYKIGYYINL